MPGGESGGDLATGAATGSPSRTAVQHALQVEEHHMTTTVAPDTRPDSTSDDTPRTPGLGAELRESLLLLGFAVGVTVGLTTAAQAALALLG